MLGLATLVAIAALIALAEGIVRVRQAMRHGTSASFESLYRVDRSIDLRVLVPGSRVGRISVNSLGFRGQEIDNPKPPGRIRIAFLGASTTFCAEASGDDAVWPQVTVQRLRERFPGVEFDFVNGGVPGYTVASSLKNWQHRVSPLQPDVVVIYHATNDLSGETRRLAEAQGLISRRTGGEPNWLSRHLRLWELAEKNLSVLSAMRGAESAQGRLMIEASSLGGTFRKDLARLVDSARQGGRRVALVTFSARLRPQQAVDERKRAAVSALVYMPFMSLDGLLAGYARYNEIIRGVAQDKSVLLIDGENLIPGDGVHFVDSVHFTDAGSRAMADRVASGLAADLAFVDLIRARQRP